MTGYIGQRAKKRRRNLLSIFILILIVILFIYLPPFIQLDETAPSDSLLPSSEEIEFPNLDSTIEDLELKIFDKKQKIIFRDNQIKKLKIDYKELQKKLSLISIEKENLLELNLELKNKGLNSNQINQEFNKLEKEYNKLNDSLLNYKEKENKLNVDNALLKDEYKKIYNINKQLTNFNDEFQNTILKLENMIEEQKLIIKNLKDNNPHG